MKKLIGSLVLIFALFLLVAAHFLSSLILSPTSLIPIDEREIFSKTRFSEFSLPEPEAIRFQNGTLRLRGWYFKHSNKQNCGMILLHGQGRSKSQMLSYAPIFWKLGCSLFLYDARAHGESDGTNTTYGFYEKMDLERAVEYFSEIDNTPEDRIGIFGLDFGGATALQFADGQFEYGFVIADSSYRDMRSWVEETFVDRFTEASRIVTPLSLSISELRGDFLVNDVSPANTAKLITQPVLILAPSENETKKTDSEMIFTNIKTKSKQIVLYAMPKEDCKPLQSPSNEYETTITNFFKEFRLNK
ncbi:alpha/beta hydrolase [Leptospira jelokensis]|uniref:Alpha/beta hydrolase n=1 Tax=Leptospira jelokensis TaxID=2484931 RepID=A0A4Z0ZSV7_9LEPT|nr:alpha/beta fold hydrolase [Leptospira jelokensis]TGL67434.1 alpha/beta hydrolase [Leptospira jelokensis]